jgi:hypothetical protein
MAAATAAGAAAAVSLIACYLLLHRSGSKLPWSRLAKPSRATGRRTRRRGLVETIGNTPLIRINSLSDATGCEVYAWIFYYVLRLASPAKLWMWCAVTVLPWVADFGEDRVPESGWQCEGPRGSQDNRGGNFWHSVTKLALRAYRFSL